MNLIGLFRYIRGEILFQARGGFPERFFNLCRVHKIKIWDIRQNGECFTAHTSISGYREIPEAARKSGMRVKIIKKIGVPFFIRKIDERKGLIAGVVVACFLIVLYTKSVWVIDVEGNSKISDSKIMDVLEENGLKKGTLKKDIDYEKYKFLLYQNIPGISWANLQIDGARMVVEITEVTQAPENAEKKICNIIASHDGIIENQVVSAGESMVKSGEAVKKGDLLVSGVTFNDKAQATQFWASRAVVNASTKRVFKAEIAKKQTKTIYTGREKSRNQLEFFRLKIPLYIMNTSFKNYKCEESETSPVICGTELPVKLKRKVLKEIRTESYTADKKTAEKLVQAEKNKFEKSFSAGTKIKSVDKKISETASFYIFIYTYSLTENIAQESPITVKNEKSEKGNITEGN